jgi:hypothetical protein
MVCCGSADIVEVGLLTVYVKLKFGVIYLKLEISVSSNASFGYAYYRDFIA